MYIAQMNLVRSEQIGVCKIYYLFIKTNKKPTNPPTQPLPNPTQPTKKTQQNLIG